MAGSELRPGKRWPAIAKGLGFLALGLFTASWLLLSLFSIRNLILLARIIHVHSLVYRL